MLNSFAGLLLCQLAGEIVSRSLGLPIPGPVIGLVLLGIVLVALESNQKVQKAFDTISEGLLSWLGILFVPAGVGCIQQAGLLGAYWPQLFAVLVISSILTMAVTAFTFSLLKNRMGQGGG